MSDRVQALIEGIAIRLHTTEGTLIKVVNETSPINCSWDELPDAWKTSYRQNAVPWVSFLAFQELGWAEELELPKIPDMWQMGTPAEKQAYCDARQDILKAGAVKFVPLEIK